MTTTPHPPVAPVSRQWRAILQRLDDANCSLSAAAMCKRKPFAGLFGAHELRDELLKPMLSAGLISVRELRRCEMLYTITAAGLDALTQPGQVVPQVAAPRQMNIMSSVLDELPAWPVASLRGHHPAIGSRGF